MKTPKWSKSDAKRAEKMGWTIRRDIDPTTGQKTTYVSTNGDRFKSDDEAIWFVMHAEKGYGTDSLADIKTCRKALFLCAKG